MFEKFFARWIAHIVLLNFLNCNGQNVAPLSHAGLTTDVENNPKDTNVEEFLYVPNAQLNETVLDPVKNEPDKAINQSESVYNSKERTKAEVTNPSTGSDNVELDLDDVKQEENPDANRDGKIEKTPNDKLKNEEKTGRGRKTKVLTDAERKNKSEPNGRRKDGKQTNEKGKKGMNRRKTKTGGKSKQVHVIWYKPNKPSKTRGTNTRNNPRQGDRRRLKSTSMDMSDITGRDMRYNPRNRHSSYSFEDRTFEGSGKRFSREGRRRGEVFNRKRHGRMQTSFIFPDGSTYEPKETKNKQENEVVNQTVAPVPPEPVTPAPVETFYGCSYIKKLKPNATDGVYSILRRATNQSVDVWCDMTRDGGGWTLFQKRGDYYIKENFFRGWNDYQTGFGKNKNEEYWLGLDHIYEMTVDEPQKLRIDLQDFDGVWKYAIYDVFRLDEVTERYRISIGAYSGDAGNSLAVHNNRPFSTKDAGDITCPNKFKGAWWYLGCHESNLNGQNLRAHHNSYGDGINWLGFRGFYYSLKVSEMKIRPRNYS